MMDQWNCTASNCLNMVLGSTVVWASTNTTGAPSWTKTGSTDLTKGGTSPAADIIAIDVGHSNPGSVIVGTNDGNIQWSSNVFTGTNCTLAASNTSSFSCTANSAAGWVNLTGSNAVLPNRAINGVAFDPLSNLTFYAAVGGFNPNTPSQPGHLYMGQCSASPCTTGNITWTDKTGALPDVPFTAVAVNPNNNKQVFTGAYLGFYYTNDITANPPVWNRYMTGLPNTRINYLAVDRGVTATPRTSTTLAAFTYGRGLFVTKIDLPAACAPPGAPTITGITDVNACAATGIQIAYTAGSPAGGSYNLLKDGTPVVTGYASGATYVPTDTNSHTYVVRALNGPSCTTDSTGVAGTDANATPGAPSITSIADNNVCVQDGVKVSYTAGSGAASHNLYKDGGPAIRQATLTWCAPSTEPAPPTVPAPPSPTRPIPAPPRRRRPPEVPLPIHRPGTAARPRKAGPPFPALLTTRFIAALSLNCQVC